MAANSIPTSPARLTMRKGALLAGAAALATVSLLTIAGNGPDSAGIRSHGVMAAYAQGASPAPATGNALVDKPPVVDKSGTFTPAQVTAMQAIIREFLMKNPEILADVSRELELKQASEQAAKAEQFLTENKPNVFASAGDVVIGNPKGDVTVVEFFDYNCGWCKKAVDDLVTLTKGDPRVRVVLKEYPIFGGPASVLAAKAAMASIKQNKYWEYHVALMREKQVTEANVYQVAERVGLNVARLKADMADKKLDAVIEQNIGIGQGLGIEGTPGFVIDSRVNVGYVPADGMKQMIGDVRKTGCKMC